MDKEGDLEVPESSEKSQSQQADDPEPAANSPFDTERTLGSICDSAPSVQTLNHLHEGKSHGTDEELEGSCVGVEAPAALDADGPCQSEILSGEILAGERLFNEHFNNPLPQRSQRTVSRTEMTDGGAGGTLGSTGQGCVSSSGSVQGDSGSAVDECPICTESYRSLGDRSMALLNCGHSICQLCLASMLGRAADCSRVQCPLCRQKTPLLKWEIYRLQEDSAFCSTPPDPSAPMLARSEPGAERSGLCSGLEQRLLPRVEVARVCGCFEHPRCLMRSVWRMQHQPHCYCCYITTLLVMCLAELSFLLLVFAPVLLLVLLFTLAS